MKVSIIIKEINPEFSQEIADRENDGHETEDNYRYSWEDELEVSEDVTDFRILNNTSYQLEGMNGNVKFSYEIPSMLLVNCKTTNGISVFGASRSLIRDTNKNQNKNGDVTFYIILKGGKKMVNPIEGIYIAKQDFPMELPVPEEKEITGDEEE